MGSAKVVATKAVTIQKGGAEIREVPDPPVTAPGDLRIRVRAVAICRTDLYAVEKRIAVDEGTVLGHEFSGVVERLGEGVGNFVVGDRVVVNPSLSCGVCECCASGFPYRCAEAIFLGLDRDGAFAELVVVPSSAVFHLGDALSFSVATFAEPVAAGLAVLEAGLGIGDQLLVYGAGRIAQLTGVILSDAGFENVEIRDQLPDDGERGFDAIIETCGLRDGFGGLIERLRPGGTLVVKSREPIAVGLPILAAIRRQIVLRAVKYGPFPDALSFVARHARELDLYLDDSWQLENFEEAFELARRSEERKICFQIGD